MFVSASPGRPTHIPRRVLSLESSADTDGDGITDIAERIVGTDPTKPDTDGDGIIDGAEVLTGTNPLDGRPAATGIVASVPAPGTARDVVTANDLALVALGDQGLGVFNIFSGLNPRLIALVNTPGNAVAVAYDGAFAAVADRDAGLVIVVLRAGPDQLFGTADDVTISGALRLGNPDLLILDLLANPLVNGTYRAVLRTTVRDAAGNSLGAESFWTFTVNDTTPPWITATTPARGESNLRTPLDLLTVNLSEAARADSVSAQSVELRGAGPDGTFGTRDDRMIPAQAVEVQDHGRRLRLTYAQSFIPDVYRATISPDVADLSGNRLTGESSWEFSVPLRTTLRGRAIFANQTPAVGAFVRRHERGTAFGQTRVTGDFLFQELTFEPFARPDLNVHLVSGNRAFLGRALQVTPVPDGVTDLGTMVLEELCPARLENHLAGESDFLEEVFAFAEFDDSTGPALYAAGAQLRQRPGLYRHDGRGWRKIPGDFDGVATPALRALAVFNDGNGPALYVAGKFDSVGGVPAANIARWNGQSWQAVGGGVQTHDPFSGGVNALAVFDDGAGSALYAGGHFTRVGNVPAANIARWNGQNWSAPGGGITSSVPNRPDDPTEAEVRAMTVFNDGTGAGLFVGGRFNFTRSGGAVINAVNIVRWRGDQWSALGRGVHYRHEDLEFDGGYVNGLAVFDDGAGSALYVAGNFNRAGELSVSNLARWSGAAWSAVGGAGFQSEVTALAPWEEAQGRALIVSGDFLLNPDGSDSARLTRWNGQRWSRLGGAQDSVTDTPGVRTFAAFNSGGVRSLFVGGSVCHPPMRLARSTAGAPSVGMAHAGSPRSRRSMVTSTPSPRGTTARESR